MSRPFSRFLLIFSLLIFLLLVLIALWIGYQHWRDPLAALDADFIFLEKVSEKQTTVELLNEKRFYTDVTLYSRELDSIHATISLPDSIPVEGLPVMIVLGGLEIGRESLKYIPAQGLNIIIAYQYPYQPRYWYDGSKITQIPAIRSAVMRVPAQVVALADWAEQQHWSDKKRLSILGYSYGAFFVPAIYHLADQHHLNLGPAVMAYGGVGLYPLLMNNLKFLSAFPRTIVAWTAAAAIYPVEPALHLPHLKGEFLVINGRTDQQIPEPCWQKFQQLTPQPKTVMILDAGHMHPSKPELTRRVVEISRQWLLERNAVNP
jgi:dienelactone hydrolase